MKEWERSEGWVLVWIVIASGLILFFNLWARNLEYHGYVRYAEVAREMIRSGEWVVPHLNGDIFIDKPPLLFWLIAIPSSLYGAVTPFIARLPSAFSAWIGVIILFLWGKRIYGTPRSGLVAAGILLSSYQYFFQSRLAKTDTLLCLFILLSLFFFHLGYGCDRNGRSRYLFNGLCFFFMGLGTLVKGPFGIVIPFLVIFLFLIKERRWKIFVGKEFIMGYAIFALTILPWIGLFITRVGLQESIRLISENKILSSHAPVYFYFVEIWGQFAPWSLLLPFLTFYLWRERRKVWNSEESIFLIWFISLFVVLTLFKIRASRYLLPALPPLALMIGGRWRKRFSFFLIPFLLSILIWHSVEAYWATEDISHSYGMLLTEELRPFLRDPALFGYRLDPNLMEEINLYLDPVVPVRILKGAGGVSDQLRKKEKGLVLMPKEVYQNLRMQVDFSVVFLHEFRYKKGSLVLVSN
ncbi:MAG: glycosyltransferase family 39 protein [Thermodesulfobacteriota bacterium]